MKQKIEELKNKISTKNFLLKAFFVCFLLVSFIFLYINNFSLQFWINGFDRGYDCDLQVYFLDVGQANSTLVIFPNKMVMVVDTGSQDSEEEMVKTVGEILHKNNIKEIEYLVLTHSDEDHVGGTIALLKSFKICNILRPKQLSKSEDNSSGYSVVETKIYDRVIDAVYNEPNCEVEFVNDQIMKFGDAQVEVFAADKDFYSATNSYSPFISIDCQDKTYLLTGDATSTREKELVDYLSSNEIELSVDYLLVSHHGSAYSTTDEFLDAVNPKIAIVSAGSESYPSKEVKDRLKSHCVEEVFVTRTCGTLLIGVDDGCEVVVYMSTFFDAPFLIVVLSLVVFVFIKFIPQQNKVHKLRENNHLMKIKN